MTSHANVVSFLFGKTDMCFFVLLVSKNAEKTMCLIHFLKLIHVKESEYILINSNGFHFGGRAVYGWSQVYTNLWAEKISEGVYITVY